MKNDLFIFAGEASGDHLGSLLIQALLQEDPDLKIHACAGPLMRKENIQEVLAMEDFQVMGFIDVIKSLPKLKKLFTKTLDLIYRLNPKLIVLIDYPGFNLRLAKKLKEKGCKAKIVQYVCPSVWAWKKGRIQIMEKYLDHLICLFPFEPSCFSNTRLQTSFIGHPLTQKISSHLYKKEIFETEKPILSIFPGSRKKEIERNLPLLLEMAKKHSRDKLSIIVSCASQATKELIDFQIQKSGLVDIKTLSSEYNYELMKASYFSFAVSGTITLELALHQVPSIVCYAISSFDFFLARKIFRINLPHYCIANLVGNRRIYPEFYGPHFCSKMIDHTLSSLLFNPKKLLFCRQECQIVKQKLEKSNPSQAAAKIILSHRV